MCPFYLRALPQITKNSVIEAHGIHHEIDIVFSLSNNIYRRVDAFSQDKLTRCKAYILIARTNIYISSRAGMPARSDEGIRRGATGDREDPL